jgi:hypothetical protein
VPPAAVPSPLVPPPLTPTPAPADPANDIPAPTPLLPAVPACEPGPWIMATADDVGGFRLLLSRTCIPAGRVLFSYVNKDSQPHNLYAEGIAPAAPARRVVASINGPRQDGETGSADLTAGTWRIYCEIQGHESMTRTLDVTPSS